jgi:lipopolysaccharide/colanic/teichoic acid biosynthesis glycosyltransferase
MGAAADWTIECHVGEIERTIKMERAAIDSDVSVDHATSRTHAGFRAEPMSKERRDSHKPHGGDAQPHVTEMRAEIARTGNAAGAVALPAPGTLPEVVPEAERYGRQHGLFARGVKRTIDLVGASLLVLIMAPVWLTIALLIKIDSPGPILFRQRRIGRDGEPFAMLKFRTMIDGADDHKASLLHLNEAADGLFKINGDPRVTRIGRWLRATSLDELPQLIHVITGRMSLVGPRPLVPEEDARITGDQRRRLQMRPGMTGAWQVAGASAIPIHEMVVLDGTYVDDWSLWLDVKLLAQTAGHVIRRKGL